MSVQPFLVSRPDIVDYVSDIDAVRYARRRNFLDEGTKISPFLTRGLITLPEVRDLVLARHTARQADKFIFELAWREYWQRQWDVLGEDIFADLTRAQHPLSSRRMPRAVHDADTGVDALDDAIRGLYEHGYMHNHARMWIAGLICNIGRTHWWQPSRWMYYHLIDGDPASNSLSWQWVAGTNSRKKYLPAQSNVNKYAPRTQHGTVIDHGYRELADMAIPECLTERTEFNSSWTPPPSDELQLDATKSTVLYHPFWLNAAWRQDQDADRVVVLEPDWFARFPVATAVTDYLISCAREIAGAQVVVANFEDLELTGDVHFMAHPSVRHWRGTAEQQPRLFPSVPERSYASFTSFWKACQRTRPHPTTE